MAVNLKGPFLLAQAVGRVMISAGSPAGSSTSPPRPASSRSTGTSPTAPARAAIVGMTKVLAIEWAQHGITVNAVSPTVVVTELGKKAWAGEVGEAMKKLIPVGRFA